MRIFFWGTQISYRRSAGQAKSLWRLSFKVRQGGRGKQMIRGTGGMIFLSKLLLEQGICLRLEATRDKTVVNALFKTGCIGSCPSYAVNNKHRSVFYEGDTWLWQRDCFKFHISCSHGHILLGGTRVGAVCLKAPTACKNRTTFNISQPPYRPIRTLKQI